MKKIAFIILGLSMTLLINYGYAQNHIIITSTK